MHIGCRRGRFFGVHKRCVQGIPWRFCSMRVDWSVLWKPFDRTSRMKMGRKRQRVNRGGET